jgi:UDP-N-acetylmuramoylalanine--D-glutamate ligase
VIWIAGGRDKAGDFTPLQDVVRKKVKQMILIGEARDKMKTALGNFAEVREEKSLKEAVAFAYHVSRTGDVVLLSPACASFDMFKNFEERGEVFKKLVWSLPALAFEKTNGNVPTG